MKKEGNEITGICCGGGLKITITDGDYTLREGIDYTSFLCRGLSNMVWVVKTEGKGKYKNLFLRCHEIRETPDGE